MESAKRIIKYQLKEDRIFSITSWFVILLANIFSYVANFYFRSRGFSSGMFHSEGNTEYLSVAGANVVAILVLFIIYSYDKYYEKLPISLSLSVTRKDFMKSIVVSNIIIAFIFSSIQSILMKVDPLIIKALGSNPIYEFNYMNIKTDSIIYIIFSTFLIALLFISLWNMIACLNYKFGGKFWLTIVLINIFFFTLGLRINKVLPFFDIFETMVRDRIDLLQFINYIIYILIFYIISYITIKRTNIKYKSN